MESRGSPISEDLLEVAELAASVPDREEQLLIRGFDALAGTVPSDLAAFLELDGSALLVRAAAGDLVRESMPKRRNALAGFERLSDLIDRRDCVVADDPGLRAEITAALGCDDARLSAGETLVVPVAAGDETIGLLVFHHGQSGAYGPETIRVAVLCGSLVALGILATRQAEEVEQYREILEERNRLLVEESAAETDACLALERCRSRVMRRLVRMAKQVAVADAPVLITGETGTGKEVLARAVHAWSSRSEGPFVQLNCAALPENLVESELFGHRKGAFSGATEDRPGRFRVADGGTLLLDEVGELPQAMQVKLLRVLQEGSFEPVGSDRTVSVDVRVVAATNVELERAVEEGRFREDLFYRLHVFPLTVPPLRDRLEDLPILVDHLLERFAKRTGRGPWTVSQRDLRRLGGYDWPGNVRELVNTLERARVLAPLGGTLDVGLPRAKPGGRRRRAARLTLEEHQREYIEETLRATRGKIYGDDGAAAVLGVPPTTLQSRLRRLGIEAARFRG